MPNVLMIDYGSSSNYGDKIVSQYMRTLLSAAVPNIAIRPCTTVPDAHIAACWSAADPVEYLLDGIDCVLLFGGSVFFQNAIRTRGTAVFTEAARRGIPILIWGGVQYAQECLVPDVAAGIGLLLDVADHVFCRFEHDLETLAMISNREVLPGSDITFMQPRLLVPSTGALSLALSWSRTDDFDSLSAVQSFVQAIKNDYPMVVILACDARVFQGNRLNVEAQTVALDTWITAHVAASRLCISTRLHPAISAVSQGTPTIALDCSDKLCPLMHDIGVPELSIPLCHVSSSVLSDVYTTVRRDEEEIHARLLSGAKAMRARAQFAFDTIVNAIKRC